MLGQPLILQEGHGGFGVRVETCRAWVRTWGRGRWGGSEVWLLHACDVGVSGDWVDFSLGRVET